ERPSPIILLPPGAGGTPLVGSGRHGRMRVVGFTEGESGGRGSRRAGAGRGARRGPRRPGTTVRPAPPSRPCARRWRQVRRSEEAKTATDGARPGRPGVPRGRGDWDDGFGPASASRLPAAARALETAGRPRGPPGRGFATLDRRGGAGGGSLSVSGRPRRPAF